MDGYRRSSIGELVDWNEVNLKTEEYVFDSEIYESLVHCTNYNPVSDGIPKVELFSIHEEEFVIATGWFIESDAGKPLFGISVSKVRNREEYVNILRARLVHRRRFQNREFSYSGHLIGLLDLFFTEFFPLSGISIESYGNYEFSEEHTLLREYIYDEFGHDILNDNGLVKKYWEDMVISACGELLE